MLAAARCVPAKVYEIPDVCPWSAFGAAAGRVRVTCRWSVEPVVSADRFESARFTPITARVVRTVVVVPLHV